MLFRSDASFRSHNLSYLLEALAFLAVLGAGLWIHPRSLSFKAASVVLTGAVAVLATGLLGPVNSLIAISVMLALGTVVALWLVAWLWVVGGNLRAWAGNKRGGGSGGASGSSGGSNACPRRGPVLPNAAPAPSQGSAGVPPVGATPSPTPPQPPTPPLASATPVATEPSPAPTVGGTTTTSSAPVEILESPPLGEGNSPAK